MPIQEDINIKIVNNFTDKKVDKQLNKQVR